MGALKRQILPFLSDVGEEDEGTLKRANPSLLERRGVWAGAF